MILRYKKKEARVIQIIKKGEKEELKKVLGLEENLVKSGMNCRNII